MRSPRYYTSIVPSCIHKLEPYFWSGRIVDAGGAVAEHDLRDGSPVIADRALGLQTENLSQLTPGRLAAVIILRLGRFSRKASVVLPQIRSSRYSLADS